MPETELYCPACGRDVHSITVWQEPGSARLRIFCDDCAALPAYAVLPMDQRQTMNLDGFRRFAVARQLGNAADHERRRSADPE